MVTRRAITLAAITTSLAGCTAIRPTAPTDYETNVTPAPLPETPTPQRPVTIDGIQSPTDLANAHAAHLNASYTLGVTQTVRDDHGTFAVRRELTIKVDPPDTYHVILTVTGPLVNDLLDTPHARTEFWSDGDQLLRRYSTNRETRYDTGAPSHDPAIVLSGNLEYWITMALLNQPPSGDIYRLFTVMEPGIEETRKRGGFVVQSSEATNETMKSRVVAIGSPESLEFRALVDNRGLVYRYRLKYHTRRGTDRLQVIRSVRVTDVGTTTVDPPAWYREATTNPVIR